MVTYTFGIKTTLLESLRKQRSLQRLDFGKTCYNDFVLARSEFLRHVFARKHTRIVTASARIIQVIKWTEESEYRPTENKCLYLITTINKELFCLEIEFR